jgi:hypothetical protein
MKKGLSILFSLGMFVAFGQNIPVEIGDYNFEAKPLSEYQLAKLRAAKEKGRYTPIRNSANNVVQRMSHVDPVAEITPLTYTTLINGCAPDSLMRMFGATDSNYVNIHAASAVLDPQSNAHDIAGKAYFHPSNPITIDTIIVYGFYDVNTSGLSGATGDKIRVDLIWGAITNNTTWRTGIQYPANTFTNQTAAIPLTLPRYAGTTAQFFHDGLAAGASNRITLEYELTVADSALLEFAIPVPGGQLIPAGNKVAAIVHFIPGYTYQLDDVIYSSPGVPPATKNGFFPVYAYDQNSVTGTPTFLEAYDLDQTSRAGFQFLFKAARYGISPTALNNEILSPSISFAALTEFAVSGTSTIGIEEMPTALSNVSDNYPNPFSTYSTIDFVLNNRANVSLMVTDMSGRMVQNQYLGMLSAGSHKATLSADNLADGIYFYTLTINGENITRKMVVKK